MRFFRFITLTLVGFFTILVTALLAPGNFFHQLLAFTLCPILSLNSAFCTDLSVVATNPNTKFILGEQVMAQQTNSSTPDLSGIWIRQGTTFRGDEQGCSVGYNGRLNFEQQDANSGVEFNLNQQGNKLIFADENVTYSSDEGNGSFVMSTNGTVSDNQVEIVYSGGGFTTQFTGTISEDGERVTGQTLCQFTGGAATATGSFTWVRQSAGSAITAQNQPNSNASIDPELLKDRPTFEAAFKQAGNLEAAELFDAYQSLQFKQHLDLEETKEELSTIEISHRLYELYQATGVKPALLQVVSLEDRADLILIKPTPKDESNSASKNLDKQRQTKDIETIVKRKKVFEANHEELLKTVRSFQSQVTNSRRHTYLESAQKLYQWLIAPIESELDTNQIDTLVISADAGFRSIPYAALHDGKSFLIEKYSFALIPSFALTDTRYENVNNLKMLAMGISESTEGENPLPAVALEIDALSNKLWEGQGFLNQETTLDTLKSLSNQQNFGIIHLATHASFSPGKINNSYILFWQHKLTLDKLRELSTQLSWENVQMLVLSACRSALGDEEAELGFAGLAVQARVRTGVASLWDIHDAATLSLMMEFYSRLKEAPIKAEALQQAQLAMLKGEIKLEDGKLILSNKQSFPLPENLELSNQLNLKHPYFWSGVTVIGNWN